MVTPIEARRAAQPLSLFELVEPNAPRRQRSARRSATAAAPTAVVEPNEPSITQMPLLLTMTEAAAVLRIGRTTVYKLAENWRATDGASGIPTVRIGAKLFVRRADLERIVDGPDEAA